jgi:hypothetical protein
VQYVQIVSLPEPTPPNGSVKEKLLTIERSTNKVQRQAKKDEIYMNLKQQLFQDRDKFTSQLAENPLYSNPNFDNPWEVVSKISDRIIDEVIDSIEENDLEFGEKTYVQDFLKLQLN